MSIGLGVALSGLTGLYGLLSSQSALRRAQEMRRQMLRDLGEQMDREYYALVESNRRGLYDAAGAGRDALESLGRGLGSALAGAGVYNSSAVAGALAKQNADLSSSLVRLASQMRGDERRLQSQNRQRLGELGLGFASGDIQSAQAQRSNAAQGLMSFLGSLSQYNLLRSGAGTGIAGRTAGAVMNGMQNATPIKPPSVMPMVSLQSLMMPSVSGPQISLKYPKGLALPSISLLSR